ncbi:MAG TPA: hypothetical protein VKM93_02820 [Terriglobia bacterium]|nr:hypothetical protein [Terriglobia bacterium]
MAGGIYLIQEGGKLVEMAEQPYDSEALLQSLIEKYPALLAGDQIDNKILRHWLLVSREASIPSAEDGSGRWAVDHLFLDQDAVPTLIEVKRSTDTRVRREVVGQMLDYAANAVVYWPIEALQEKFEATCQKQDRDSEDTLIEFLGGDGEPDGFWTKVKTNLQAGKIRLIFVADEIPQELKRIVEFLNQQMDPAEVLAVEIRQYSGEGLKTLVPRVIGQTAEASTRKSASPPVKRQWDEESFFRELSDRKGAKEAAVARKILEWARPKMTRIWWGGGGRTGSFVAILNHKGRDHQLFAVFTYGKVEIYFYWYQYKPPFDSKEKRQELLGRLNSLLAEKLPEDVITRRPAIPLSALEDDGALQEFSRVFDWFVAEVRAS